jgi:hypothetical protein
MISSEICRNGLSVRLIEEDERFFLQVSPTHVVDDLDGMIPCNPEALCSVLQGLTYQLASESGYVVIKRERDDVTLEYQGDSMKEQFRLPVQRFSQAIAPVLPLRLRAMIL